MGLIFGVSFFAWCDNTKGFDSVSGHLFMRVYLYIVENAVRSGITRTCHLRTPTLRALNSWVLLSDMWWQSSSIPRQVCRVHSHLIFIRCFCHIYLFVLVYPFRFPIGLIAEWSSFKVSSILFFSPLCRSLFPDFQGTQTTSDSCHTVWHFVSVGWDCRRPWRGSSGQNIFSKSLVFYLQCQNA